MNNYKQWKIAIQDGYLFMTLLHYWIKNWIEKAFWCVVLIWKARIINSLSPLFISILDIDIDIDIE